ncbi:biopolymer transport protein ExbB; uptake of enterobactin, tonB-dependent uptake of B colicins [Bradyrhizobium sp. ORS 278]|uniref:tonB-system energizer ExbB n=1 Tax=Bradyrhizobium sp. (strain ORS 278) TaxID=114615 RepID=UPI0001508E8F|nr:tonB-system energizer ExbB [Bradyrhizobium sp. ORS 278]CAL78383.1 biopolymer transport protein ExbB; uptake of enterobactin, tonB-dependent uptake of B colicins [Bradyrhizobium sp. ORS 278]
MMTSLFARLAIVLSFAIVFAAAPAGAQQVSQPTPPAPAISTDVSARPAAGQAATSAESGARTGKTIATGLDELSPLGMFLKADIVVKAVMIALALASVASWTILIAKSIEFSVLRRRLIGALRKLTSAKSLAEAQLAVGQGKDRSGNIAAVLLQAAITEARLSAGLNSDEGIKERAASSFSEIVRAEARRVRVGMGLLATVGAISPFVGLFGTVWGIMNSFIGISKSQTTNLAVVAPGIAEALLATAIGLAAAIPAVIIYNHFSRVTKGYLELVNRASGATGRLLSRDLDRSHVSVHARAAE